MQGFYLPHSGTSIASFIRWKACGLKTTLVAMIFIFSIEEVSAKTLCKSTLDFLARHNLTSPTSTSRVFALRNFILRRADAAYAKAKEDEAHQIAELEADFIDKSRWFMISFGEQPGVRKPSGVRRHYLPLLQIVDGDRMSLHGYRDILFGLELPSENQETPWQLLSPKEREQLTFELAQSLRAYFYDRESVANGGRSFADLYRAFRDVGPAGFRPLPFHAHRYLEECPVGICRLTNPALVGGLAELGLPGSDVRLKTGYREDGHGHMWFEIRFSPRGPWKEGDATPDAGRSGLSSMVVGEKLHYWDGSISERFPVDQESFDFLMPMDLVEHPDARGINYYRDDQNGD